MLHRRLLLERIEKWLSSLYWKDVNIQSFLYGQCFQIDNIRVYEVTEQQRPTFDEIRSCTGNFRNCEVGESFGPIWSTCWFKFAFSIPKEMIGYDIYLLWDSNSEALLYDWNGNSVQAFTGGGGDDRRDSCLLFPSSTSSTYSSERTFEYYIEMACNGMFGNGNGMIEPPDSNRMFRFEKLQLVVMHQHIIDLFWDLKVLYELITTLPDTHCSAAKALQVCNSLLNTVDWTEKESCIQSRSLVNEILHHLTHDSSSKAVESTGRSYKLAHEITALGHCHIDTAWLWPYAETRRKIRRSWCTQATLMERYPNFKFVTSQTVHWEWLKEDDISLFRRLKDLVVAGRIVPVGGSYVEFDANMPSGESMLRQLLYGQSYFQEEFDMQSSIFWLPDTFGYSAQLPQILSEFNMPYFLSQKLSWNLFNKFPHSTFDWEGIDGSRVLAHFPPVDSYNSDASPGQILKSCENHKSQIVSNKSMLLFGHGDGGGGPAVSHLEQLARLQHCDAMPIIHLEDTPEQFFTSVAKDQQDSREKGFLPVVWVGELYLELHQGALTSQANIKYQNRRCESLLRGLDAIFAMYTLVVTDIKKKCLCDVDTDRVCISSQRWKKEVKDLWKDLLLNQFHDVLPGTSIAMVYEDSNRMLSHVLTRGNELISQIISAMIYNSDTTEQHIYFNPTGFYRNLSAELSVALLREGKSIDIPPFGLCTLPASDISSVGVTDQQLNTVKGVSISEISSGFILENSLIRVTISHTGGVLSLIDKRLNKVSEKTINGKQCSDREVIGSHDDEAEAVGNNLILYEDIPFFWDAWDTMAYHLMSGVSLNVNPKSISATALSQGQSEIPPNKRRRKMLSTTTSHSFFTDVKLNRIGVCVILSGWGGDTRSKITQRISIGDNSALIDFDTSVEWYENRKLLKVEFPLSVRSSKASYEIQFGVIQRPTHTNTPFDAAMFEVCGHRFSDLSEDDYGVALLNDSKYGHSCRNNTLCLTLLRSPKSPDPECDMEIHHFKYALLPHLNSSLLSGGVIQAANIMNSPIFGPLQSSISTSNKHFTDVFNAFQSEWIILPVQSSLVLDTVKVSEQENDIILRFYESVGRRGSVNVRLHSSIGHLIKCVYACNANEKVLYIIPFSIEMGFFIKFEPFKIKTIKLWIT